MNRRLMIPTTSNANRTGPSPRTTWVRALLVATACLAALSLWAQEQEGGKNFKLPLSMHHLLISDQFNNRVIEVDEKTGEIVWQFGIGPADLSAKSPLGVNDSERIGTTDLPFDFVPRGGNIGLVGPLTLIAATGIPAGASPFCTDPNGCPDSRVLLVDMQGHIVWQYGTFGVTGSGPDELNYPVQATYLPTGRILITDQGNQRVIEVNHGKDILWQYGITGFSGDGPNELSDPNSAELLENGNVLIADEGNNRVLEVTRQNAIVSTFTAGGTLGAVAFASRLPNGDTLMTDAGNNRIVEVDQGDNIVWQYYTNLQKGSNPDPQPSRGIRLRDGRTLISDQYNQRVIEVDPNGSLMASYGNLDVSGFSPINVSLGLFAPYDAKMIGDFTGLTPPYGMLLFFP